jgi:anionic cell wall polymer biosynthesis LytR-Cps2A-Psr (LCP) family protein
MQFHRRRRSVTAIFVALAIAGSGSLAGPVAAASGGSFNRLPWLELAASLLAQFPTLGELGQDVVGPSSLQLGSDGRLTVLVVGSDFRTAKPSHGERLDTVVVATINPNNHQMAAVSIPRDTGNLPLPDPSDTYAGKVNSLFAHYRRIVGTREAALEKMREAIAYALQVEIDYVAFTRFDGFDFLVDQVDGVYVDIAEEIRDNRIVDDKTKPKGAKFLAASGVRLGGASATKCYATAVPINWANVPNCKRALLYVRSRHGSVGVKNNNDYKRDKREQQFLMGALARVISRGSGASLIGLRDAAQSRPTDFYTTLPITANADLLALFNMFNGAQNQPFTQAVLKPDKYAYHAPGTRRYELKLDVVRALTAQLFAKVN